MHNMKSMRDSFANKWNKKLITNVLDDSNFRHNNVGASHLTAPLNYSLQPEIRSLMRNNQDGLLANIDMYKSKLHKVDHFSTIPLNDVVPDANNVKTAKKKTQREIRMDLLA